jgi:hypothetical protein
MKATLPGAMLLLAALQACSFAPRYKVPDSAPATSAYKEAGDWKAAQPLDEQNRGEWWAIFQDPQLDALEAKVADANQDPDRTCGFIPHADRRFFGGPRAGFGQFTHLSEGRQTGLQRFRCGSRSVLRDRSLGPGA